MVTLDLSGEISKVAYELYEKSGRIEGHDFDNWLEAEKIVMTQYAGKNAGRETVPRKKSLLRKSTKNPKL